LGNHDHWLHRPGGRAAGSELLRKTLQGFGLQELNNDSIEWRPGLWIAGIDDNFYGFDDLKKATDDNEPSGTAGAPILNVLEKNELTNTIAIVVRYFGGTKLGAGGLIRAYSKSVRFALKKTNKIEYIKYSYIKIKTSYDNKDYLKQLENKYKVIKKNFSTNINYTFEVEENKKEQLLKELEHLNKKDTL
jgi:uncharacterized YigZ family protein